MRVAIAGAGAVGRSDCARADPERPRGPAHRPEPERHQARAGPRRRVAARRLPRAVLARGGAPDHCDVVIAATGDDKVNLVTSLLAKTEFGCRAPSAGSTTNNEWLFTEAWGVDVNVSTRGSCRAGGEAVAVGDLVRLFTFRQGNANLVEMTLPADSPYVGKPTGWSRSRELRAGDDPARRPGLRPDPEQPIGPATSCCSSPLGRGGGPRAALAPSRTWSREFRRSSRVPARVESSGHGTGRSLDSTDGLDSTLDGGDRCSVAGQHRPSRRGRPAAAASPSRSWGRRAARRRAVGSHRAGPAGEPDGCLDDDPQQAGYGEQPGQQRAEPDDLPVPVPAVGSPVTLPTMNPTSGQPTRQVNDRTRCSRRCR